MITIALGVCLGLAMYNFAPVYLPFLGKWALRGAFWAWQQRAEIFQWCLACAFFTAIIIGGITIADDHLRTAREAPMTDEELEAAVAASPVEFGSDFAPATDASYPAVRK